MAHFVDRSHAARTQRTQHFIVANPIARPEDHFAARSHPSIMASSRVQGNKGERSRSGFRTMPECARENQAGPPNSSPSIARSGRWLPRCPAFPTLLPFISSPRRLQRRVEKARASLLSGSRQSPYPFWQRPMGVFNQFRTVILDRALNSARPPEQLVILGAGLDSRAWRLDSLKDTVVFEVDYPSSQAWKRERSASIPFKAKDVRFVAMDFQRDRLGPLIQNAGFDARKTTFWLWEGVTMYLRPDEVSANSARSPLCRRPAAASPSPTCGGRTAVFLAACSLRCWASPCARPLNRRR